jgi:hypothetical protein
MSPPGSTYPKPLSVTWPLVLTSTSWYGVYFYARSLVAASEDPIISMLSAVVFCTASLSLVHWLDARHGTRQKADKAMARLSCVVFSIVAVLRVRDATLMLYGWPLWILMAAFFKASDHYFTKTKGDAKWVVCHGMFHVCVGIGQCMVLHGASHPGACRHWA